MAEAERIKAKAQEDGYAAGVAAAEKQIQTELSQMADSLAKVLESVAVERKNLWASYRQDFVTLLRLAVERTVGVTIDARREEILGSLLNEALDLVDAKDSLTLTVHPDDEGLVRELMIHGKSALAQAADNEGGDFLVILNEQNAHGISLGETIYL